MACGGSTRVHTVRSGLYREWIACQCQGRWSLSSEGYSLEAANGRRVLLQARRRADERPWGPFAGGSRTPISCEVGYPHSRGMHTAAATTTRAADSATFSFSASGWLIGYHFGVIAGLEVCARCSSVGLQMHTYSVVGPCFVCWSGAVSQPAADPVCFMSADFMWEGGRVRCAGGGADESPVVHRGCLRRRHRRRELRRRADARAPVRHREATEPPHAQARAVVESARPAQESV